MEKINKFLVGFGLSLLMFGILVGVLVGLVLATKFLASKLMIDAGLIFISLAFVLSAILIGFLNAS